MRKKTQRKQSRALVHDDRLSPQQLDFLRFYLDRDSETYGNAYQSAIKVGYSQEYAEVITREKWVSEKVRQYADRFDDAALYEKHEELLNAARVDHMVFPLETPDLTDEDIGRLLQEVNCKVRKIIHGETARHVYFWSADNKARKEALDMAYKIKGTYAPAKHIVANFNFDAELKNRAKKAVGEIAG